MDLKQKLEACLAAATTGPDEIAVGTTYKAMLERGETLNKNQVRFIEKLHGEVLRQSPEAK